MPNLANPNNSPPPAPGEDNKQPGIIATTIIVTVVADIFVGLRLIVRKWITKSIGWDDWTIIAAAVRAHSLSLLALIPAPQKLGITIGCALVVVEVHYGFGRHKTDLTHQQYSDFTRYSYGEWIQTFATLMFTKVSICLFLLRIVIGKAFIRSLQVLIGALVLSNIILTILWIVQCRPVWLSWVNPETSGSCFTQLTLQKIILAQAGKSVATTVNDLKYSSQTSRFHHFGFHIGNVSHLYPSKAPDDAPSEDRLVHPDGTRNNVSIVASRRIWY